MSARLRFEAELSELGLAPRLEREADVARVRAGDALGRRILDLLWEPIAATDVPRMADRLRRLERVLDAVPDDDAGALLRRLSPGGDLVRDFDYRLSTPTRSRLREKLRLRATVRPVVVPVPQPTPPDVDVPPPPPPPPQPTPAPTGLPSPRGWKPLGTFVWRSHEKRVKKFRFLDVFVEFEAEVEGSLNANDREWADVKGRLLRVPDPRRPGTKSWTGGPEVELKLNRALLSSVKLELDGRGGARIAFAKEFDAFALVKITPHLQTSTSFAKVEFELSKELSLRFDLLGLPARIELKPKGVLIFRVNWLRVLGDRLHRRIEEWVKRRLTDLLDLFGRGVARSVALKVLGLLLGAELAAILLEPAPNVVVAAPPGDVARLQQATEWAHAGQPGMGLKAISEWMQRWADRYRKAFANAYADSLRQLMSKGWKDALQKFPSTRWNGFRELPLPNAPAAEWQKWASTDKALETISLPPSPDAPGHFRWYEIALMFAVAAYILRRITKSQFDDVATTCMHQASLAGMSLAVVAVRKRLNRETYRYVDEKGVTVSVDGKTSWDQIVRLLADSGITPDELNERLAALALRQLPPL